MASMDEELTGRVLASGEYDGIQLAEETGLLGKKIRIRVKLPVRPVDKYTIKEPTMPAPRLGTPLHAEPVRAYLSASIHYALIGMAKEESPPERPTDVKNITGFRVGPSETRLRVRMTDDTFRTFTITLRENRL
jgi:hypothetical protein